VQYAHSHLIIHRDLKPSNILTTEDGRVKLLDFGIAKLLDDRSVAGAAVHTRTGVRLLTPSYASPEQVRGTSITTACDVHQLGVLLYQLLTGRAPYEVQGASWAEQERIICEEEPLAPSHAVTRVHDGAEERPVTPETIARQRRTDEGRLRRKLRGDLDKIVLMALHKEPERRHTSVEHLVNDIERFLAGQPVTARKDTLGYKARKFVGRHPAAVTAAASFVLFLIGTAVVFAVQADRLERERDRARTQEAAAAQVSDFLTGLFEANDPAESLGDTITARELLERGVSQAHALDEQPEIQARMLGVLGRVNRSLGRYDQAKPLLEEALELQRAAYGPTHLAVAASMLDLAELLLTRGEDEAAEPLFREALALHLELNGGADLDLARSLEGLARIVRRQDRASEAESLFYEALSVRRQLPESDDPEIANTMSELAAILVTQGDLEAGELLRRDALAMLERIHGGLHPDVAEATNDLGVQLHLKGDYEAAESFYRKALDLQRRLYGDVHPLLANTINNLAILLRTTGDLDAAEDLLRQGLAMRQELHGERHRYTSNSMQSLAILLRMKGDYEGAELLLLDVLAIRREAYGDEHTTVGRTANSLAALYLDMGRHDEAFRYSQEANSIARKALGENHSQTLTMAHVYARALWARGDYAAADSAFQVTIERYREHQAGHPSIAAPLASRADLLMERGRAEAAEPLLREALSVRESALPSGHWRIAVVQALLGRCLGETGRYAEAEKLLLEAEVALADQPGEARRQRVRALAWLVELYEGLDRPDRAGQIRESLRLLEGI
jgi:serine/threonine-protein kinase